jgi:hypothetical protein
LSTLQFKRGLKIYQEHLVLLHQFVSLPIASVRMPSQSPQLIPMTHPPHQPKYGGSEYYAGGSRDEPIQWYEGDPKGYEGLARFMGAYPELAIFRRFGALNLRNIMFMQAEIADLEEQYDAVVDEDNEAGDHERATLSQAWRLVARGNESNSP